jgi:hypothetical protein
MSRNLSVRPTVASHLESRLNTYSIAAAAAGVSLFAAAVPATATVVIKNVHTTIPACDVFFPCPVYLDLNGDGINDFKFQLDTSNYAYDFWRHLRVTGESGGAVMGTAGGTQGPYASCLVKGAKVGPAGHFKAAPLMEGSFVYSFNKSSGKYSRHLYGNWGGNHTNRYLGVKFKIGGATHFGWIRFTLDSNAPGRISATITQYGYETVANKAVSAGLAAAAAVSARLEQGSVPSPDTSLGMLALGADGLALWRRDETQATN